jgi:poly-gamma-glutamate capsule biosynthesis protein CapA/YwtB (metallophosphatase superfamily)
LQLAAVGDFMLDREFSPHKAPFRKAFHILSKADVVFANLENPLGTKGHPREKMFVFRSKPALAKVVADSGVDVVTIANNHMLDYGEEVLMETLRTLLKAKIPFVGAGRNIAEAEKPVIIERGGVRVAFLGLAATLPLGAGASQERPGLAPIHVTTSYEFDPTLTQEQPGNPPKIRTQVDPRDQERICSNIREARKLADHVIVGIHWGVAFTKERAEYQQPLGRKMIDAGAGIIVGHHSHMRQGIEHYRNGVILYSLGDFVFHDRVDMTGESGMIATAKLSKDRIEDLNLWPVTVEVKTGLPILGGAKEARELFEDVKQQSVRTDFKLKNNSVKIEL